LIEIGEARAGARRGGAEDGVSSGSGSVASGPQADSLRAERESARLHDASDDAEQAWSGRDAPARKASMFE